MNRETRAVSGEHRVHPGRGRLHHRGQASPAARLAARARRGYRELTGPVRILPSFLVIGAARAGSTSLYAYLLEHPDVGAPSHKEIHYFDLNYERGLAWYRRHFPTRLARTGARLRGGELVTGEASPYYLFHPHVPGRVRATLPDARLIALLRDPVERAYSQYQLAVRNGRETLSFEEAIEREEERIGPELERLLADPSYRSLAHRHHSYLARGVYADQLERWFAAFPAEQLLVLESDELFSEPARVYARALRFLGLREHSPATFETYNRRPYEELAVETRERLRAYYAPHNSRLESLLGRELGWS